MKILTNEDLEDRNKIPENLTVGRLKEALKNFPDDAVVMIERVEDHYYENNGWGVQLMENEAVKNAIDWNTEMEAEIALRVAGKEWEYDKVENPELCMYSQEEIESMKSQYHPAFCVTSYNGSKHLYINLHF